MMDNLSRLFDAEEKVRRWSAEYANAAAHLDVAKMNRNIAYLISQHEPVNSLGIDREMLRFALQFVGHGDLHRLNRELAEFKGAAAINPLNKGDQL